MIAAGRTIENKKEKQRGPNDKSYVNKSQAHGLKYEPKRKKGSKKFGSASEESEDPGQRK